MDLVSNSLFYKLDYSNFNLSLNFKQLKNRIPSRILEKAIWGMLPKGVLGREYYRRLFIYSNNDIKYKKTKDGISKTISLNDVNENNWIKIN